MRPTRRIGPVRHLRLISAFLVLPFIAPAAPVNEGDDAAAQEILGKYLEAKEAQRAALRGVQMDVEIDAKLPSREKFGRLKALRSVSRLGKITYKALGFAGDSIIKNEVIARFLAEETKPRDNAITPSNYKFKYKGMSEHDGLLVHVFQVTPKKKAEGLFRGELWLDAATAMPLRESGRPVKPSLLVKKMEFIQEYEIRDGVAIPKHFQGTADLRIVGRAELSVDYSNFRQELAEDASANETNR